MDFTQTGKSLTEITTENTNREMDGRMGDARQSWQLFKDFCQDNQIDNALRFNLWEVYLNHYVDAPIPIVLSILRQMLQDQWQKKGGSWTQTEYTNFVGLFHHRMKTWHHRLAALEDE
jgi:hypothetical protein